MPIRVEADPEDDRVVVITIDRPEARNALDPEHQRDLGAAVADFEADDARLVAVLTGAGDTTFSAGADLKKLIPAYREAVRAGEDPPWNFGGFTATTRFKPLIAAVNGHALAGGLEMALACDIRLCSPNATFGLAETKWAIIPGAGGTVRLPRTVPLGLAMEMVLSGEPIDAAEAYRSGLVNRWSSRPSWSPRPARWRARSPRRVPSQSGRPGSASSTGSASTTRPRWPASTPRSSASCAPRTRWRARRRSPRSGRRATGVPE
ncbi:enoyl-CoA hydratase/isomerase family protein [Actinomycetospora sp. NBRC 106378]|uniref:enoyl-CoA hydratase/isomerase family protein n=1 Tax=Actinomycetospora sp. NBRC 106378 TaxID=3032208 RepID=UPI0024A58A14|nr:enoyl-CoA hydratase/isomerase family protein [Actinomycetospora sp. NBRC 106378]GLZ56357.1 hypothetical protein Acsp07_59740 [Actinomycetospora sp. NBRC 106378]